MMAHATMARWGLWLAALLAGALGGAWAQSSGPHIGYAYPAGGRQGTTFRVTVGGQQLGGADVAYVSGPGVRATVVEYIRPLNDNELGDADFFIRELVRRRWNIGTMRWLASSDDPPELPDHAWLRDLDHRSWGELKRLRQRLFDPRKQPNSQIADQVVLDVTVAPDAPPGDRELRLATPRGLTNPMCFQVSALPEACEEDVAEPAVRVLGLPVLLNGQIMPGEEDRFHVRARQGQQLVIGVQARRLVPYIADAVPGWFQPTVSLRAANGREVGYADDYGSDPDPVLLVKVPADGEYVLEIRDSIYRGRDDFVYRVSVGETPFITHMFPLGAREGTTTSAAIWGWNLPTNKLPLDAGAGGDAVRTAQLAPGSANDMLYAVGSLPEALEAEPNDATTPQQVSLPVTINGRIAQSGDVDAFRFAGRSGEEIVAEVLARRLGSPLDSWLQLIGPDGTPVTTNDDTDDPAAALIAHQADSYLRVTLPADGAYVVTLADVQAQGSEAHAYRLRLSAPQPDFALRVVPAGLALSPGQTSSVALQAVRRDGFAGEIEVTLKDPPAGFISRPARLAGDKDTTNLVLTAPRDVPHQAFALQFEGRAQMGDTVVIRPGVPAEKMMQAFAYWHLVPQRDFVVAIPRPRPVPAVWRPLLPGVRFAGPARLQLPQGGTAVVQFAAPAVLPDARRTPLRAVQVGLGSRPRGVTVAGVQVTPTGLAITLQADSIIAHAGDAGNLLLYAWTEVAGAAGDLARERVGLGALPPIPFEIVRS